MDITRELPVLAEQRLRRVLAHASLTVHQGAWAYEEFDSREFAQRARPDALALVRQGDRWSQLKVAETESTDLMGLWTFAFESSEPNSGFVGWLASRIKEQTGAGVVVVCGYDSMRGGVYDHWGCPADAFDDVIGLIHEIRSGAVSAPGELDLDGRLMNASSTAETGVINTETIFSFRQKGNTVSARYQGGRVVDGYLCGRIEGRQLQFRYTQLQDGDVLDGGESTCQLEQLDDGRWQIREQFEWASGSGSGENLITELPFQ